MPEADVPYGPDGYPKFFVGPLHQRQTLTWWGLNCTDMPAMLDHNRDRIRAKFFEGTLA